MTDPLVAICVPAHGSPDGLRALLDALDRLDYPRDRLEVVVAVDGPDDRLEAEAARATTTVVLPENRGSYAARNAAIDAASPACEILIFTDADCRPVPEWVRAHVAALQEADLVGGGVRFTHRTPPTAAEWVDMTRFLQQEHLVTAVGFAATCNLSGRAETFRRLRFDDRLRSGGDLEFGRRSRAAGYRLDYAANAAVLHPARDGLGPLLRKVRRVSQGASVLPPDAAAATVSHPAPPRPDPAAWSRAHGFGDRPAWSLRCRAVGLLCSLTWAAGAPSTIVHRLRRGRG